MTKRLLNNPTCSNKAAHLNAVPGLQHHHTVPSDHHHPDLVLRFLFGELDGVVQHQIHEGIKTAEGAFNLPPAVDPEVNPLVHELLELWWVCLRHLGLLDKELSCRSESSNKSL